jgi:hypothetical protein
LGDAGGGVGGDVVDEEVVLAVDEAGGEDDVGEEAGAFENLVRRPKRNEGRQEK